jgi:hypothetical protein
MKGNAMAQQCYKCNTEINFGYFLDNPDGTTLYWCNTPCDYLIDWDAEDKAGRM